MAYLRRFSQALFISTSLLALFTCPYSKVEESFNLQATHDLFYHSLPSWTPDHDAGGASVFDHLRYPGVVPRTFTGPLILAYISYFISWIASPIDTLSPLQIQFLARLVLLTFSWHAWFRLARALDQKTRDLQIGSYLLIISACQFHIPYYASRMLPNTFALVLVLHAYAEWILGKYQRAAAGLVAATAIFRCDILLLLFTVGLSWLIRGDLTLSKAIQVGVMTGVICLAVTIPLDSLMWQTWTWPEGQVFYYNAILGKSSDWGTSPWHWYVSTAIPKAMLATLVFLPLAVLRIPSCRLDTTWLAHFLPITGFILLYSCLGHKEMRFMFPAMPILNLAAAVGMTKLHQLAFPPKTKSSSRFAKLSFLGGIGCIISTLLASLIFLQVSKHNYPGGQALELATAYLQEKHAEARVWIDVASSMSGVSLFGQRNAMHRTGIQVWDKGGYEEENTARDFEGYTHLLSEKKDVPGFRVVDVARGRPRIDKRRLSIKTQDAIYLLERNDWNVQS
jgi:alpha-1,6-mannosyltransferase